MEHDQIKSLFPLTDRTLHPNCVIYEGTCSCGKTYVGETGKCVQCGHNRCMSTTLAKLNIQFIWNYLRVRAAYSCVLMYHYLMILIIITSDATALRRGRIYSISSLQLSMLMRGDTPKSVHGCWRDVLSALHFLVFHNIQQTPDLTNLQGRLKLVPLIGSSLDRKFLVC